MSEEKSAVSGEPLGVHMSPRELMESGILMEANRVFFHPLGLALGITWTDDNWGGELFIFDGRDDEVGYLFHDLSSQEDRDKYDRVAGLRASKRGAREEKFGWMVQPIGHKFDE